MRTNFQLPLHSPPSCSSSRVDYFHFRIRPRARVGFACPFSYSSAVSSKHYIFRRDYMFRSVLGLNTFWDVRSFWTKLSPTKNHSIYRWQHLLNDPGTKSCNKALNDCRYCWQASGGSRRGARLPSPLFLDQTEARRAEKNLVWPPPSPAVLVYPNPKLSGGASLRNIFSVALQASVWP